MKIPRKEFNKIFKAYHDKDTQIWVVAGVHELDDLVIKLAISVGRIMKIVF